LKLEFIGSLFEFAEQIIASDLIINDIVIKDGNMGYFDINFKFQKKRKQYETTEDRIIQRKGKK
jgi:hypothetical protein